MVDRRCGADGLLLGTGQDREGRRICTAGDEECMDLYFLDACSPEYV